MVFGSYETPKAPTLPTFLQYLKTVSKGVVGKTRFQIEIIWLPGKFDNVTLQTNAFRYVCSPNHPLYTQIQEYIKGESDNTSSQRIDMVIDDVEKRLVSLHPHKTIKGSWESLGSNAFKFKNP